MLPLLFRSFPLLHLPLNQYVRFLHILVLNLKFDPSTKCRQSNPAIRPTSAKIALVGQISTSELDTKRKSEKKSVVYEIRCIKFISKYSTIST